MKHFIPNPLFRWIASFVALDVFLLLFVFLNCLGTPELCGEGSGVMFGIFYQFPFGIFLPDFGTWNGVATSTLVAPLLGLFTHLTIGAWFGVRRRNKAVTWTDAILTALGINILVVLVPATLYMLAGYLVK
ncbi:MAG: hypothetical protein RLZZ324_708 [Candidatus Parcubacteria bacterium]|jgi:hypothetical protein